MTLDMEGNILHQLVLPPDNPQLTEESLSVQYEFSGGQFLIFTASTIHKAGPGASGIRHGDFDIRLEKLVYDPLTGFSEAEEADFNSINWSAIDGMAFVPPIAPSSIFSSFPPNNFNDYYPYGPEYVNTSFERNLDNCSENIIENGFNIEDWSNGSEDKPYGMVMTQDKIVISALLNRLIMWTGINEELGGDNLEGLKCEDTANPCLHYERSTYQWGEAYVLFINKSDLSLDKAVHLGTMSGSDFQPKIIQTSDGGFAVSGTISACPDGLDMVPGNENMMVIKLDANGNVEWRNHFTGPADASCGFSVTEAPDGGLVLAGNSENETPLGEEENYYILKISPKKCDYFGTVIHPNQSNNNDYIVSGQEIWSTDVTVAARVVVPDGAELRIIGSAGTPITIHFAHSQSEFEFEDPSMIGISVQPGGKLVVQYATLTGVSCNGQDFMWDGISVEGRPDLPQTPANQGYCTMVSANIVNARHGLFACGMQAQKTTYAQPPSGSTGSQNILTNASLVTDANGGAKIVDVGSHFINNYRSVHFVKYNYNQNNSFFNSTQFVSDGPLVDANYRKQPLSLNFSINEARGTFIHASIWATRVRFSNCDFSGSTAIIEDFRPIGITGAQPQIIASGGNMNNLKIGVEAQDFLQSALSNVDLNNITFDNVTRGVELRNTAMDRVQGCHFLNIPNTGGYANLLPIGVATSNTFGPEIVGNDFHGTNNNFDTYGLVVFNSMEQGADIRENEFFDTRIGNQFEGSNTLLSARCNDYTGMGFSGWSVTSKQGFGDLGNQGSGQQGSPKADNEFFDPCVDALLDNHIFSNGIAFEYHDKTGNPHPAVEDCVSPIVDLTTHVDFSVLACATSEPPCDPPCKYTEFINSNQTLKDRNKALRGIIHPGVDSEDN
ncbi:MAG: hypothetical protein D6714_05960, partial [Bacteroidetes bacterium]